MPEGIVAEVDSGFATLDFVDTTLRGPSLHKLLEIGGPATIETITRRGPRRQYRVPEGNARAAGLIDEPSEQARGLDVDGTPDDNPTTGGTGTTTSGAIHQGVADTGAAAALKAADPNVNPGLDKENWHTPTAEHTSANKFVGVVSNAAVLHSRNQVFTGTGGLSDDSNLTHPATSSDLIAYVKEHGNGLTRSDAKREPQVPAAHIAGALRDQPAALGSDPGGYAPPPDRPAAHVDLTAGAVVSPFADGPPAPASSSETARPSELPEGVPDDKWKRAELNAYAEWRRIPGAAEMGSKAEVLTAIQKAENS